MKDLSLFPLSSIVLPGGRLPLRIFEPRYLSMVTACLKSNTGFGICLISSGSEAGVPASIFPYGTLVNIVDWDREDSGLLTIVTKGVQKLRVVDSSANADGLLIGEVELMPIEPKAAIPAKYQELADLLQRALSQAGPFIEYQETDFTDATWVSSRLIELLPMSSSERHELVAINESIERLAVLQSIVDRQT